MAMAVNEGKAGKKKCEQMAKECTKSSKGSTHNICVFCSVGANDEKCGKMFMKKGVSVHYFCMRCTYCRKIGATIGCVVRNCKKMFHLGCGRSNGTMHQFFGTFCSYCPSHRLKQDVPSVNDPNVVCSICMNLVTACPSYETLRAPCCSHYWYHRDCVQAYAMSAGLHFFKCPLCNNKDDFQDEMVKMGIYVPDQDASWEKEPNAFQELLERYNRCDAVDCKCDKGRTFNKDDSKWEIILCDFCGSHGSHKICKHLIKHGKHKICQDCKSIEEDPEHILSPCTERKSLEDLQLEMSSPNTSKAASLYPGPSSAMKKKGIPPSYGTKKKKSSKNLSERMIDDSSVPTSKKVRIYKTATKSNAESGLSNSAMKTAYSNQRVYGKNVAKVDKVNTKKKNYSRKIPTGLNRSQSILRDWLQSQNSKSKTHEKKPADSSGEQLTPLRSSPRKKTPMFVSWEGKELLIKSPRVVIHRKRIYSRMENLNPNLTIDMNDGKLGSDWHMEMELLANIDTDQRVTRNMIDINAAKSVIEQSGAESKVLTLYDISPKKEPLPLFPKHIEDCNRKVNRKDVTPQKEQFLPLFPDFKHDNKRSPGQLSCYGFYNLEKKGNSLKNNTSQNSIPKRKSLKNERPDKNASIEKYLTTTSSNSTANTLSSSKSEKQDHGMNGILHQSTESPTLPKIISRETLSAKKYINSAPTEKGPLHDSYGPNDSPAKNLRHRKLANDTNPSKSSTSPIYNGVLKQYYFDRNQNDPELNTVMTEDCDHSHNNDASSVLKSLLTCDMQSAKRKTNSEHELTPARKKHVPQSRERDDSPAKNLRQRKQTTSHIEKHNNPRKMNDTDQIDGETCNPDMLDRLKKCCSQLDKYHPKFRAVSDGTHDQDNNHDDNDSPIFTKVFSRDTRPSQRMKTSECEMTPPRNSFVPESCGLVESPAKSLRQRKLTNDFENCSKVDEAEKKHNKLTSSPSILKNRLKNYSFPLEQYYPALQTGGGGTSDLAKMSTPPALEKVSPSVEQQDKRIYWRYDGTRQIENTSSNVTSEDISTKTLQSEKKQPVSSNSSSPWKTAVSLSPARSSPRNKVSSDDRVVDTLGDLQNLIPSYDLQIDSEALCETYKNLESPIFSTKFRKFLSSSRSSDSTSKNNFDKNLTFFKRNKTSLTKSSKHFPLSSESILSTANVPANNIKWRSSPRLPLHSDSPTESVNDQSIMTEYYNGAKLS